ncbi:MAG: response regulator transcription factor, partial [Chloroflexi bacterium]|nr:response regulator transcription factor [Chloroflexota bacterium]
MGLGGSAPGQASRDGASRILMVDHDVLALEPHQMQLSQAGHHVFSAAPGPHALQAIWGASPDLVVLRFCPSRDRWDFCQRLLASTDAPLFVLLSASNRQDCIRALEMGVD